MRLVLWSFVRRGRGACRLLRRMPWHPWPSGLLGSMRSMIRTSLLLALAGPSLGYAAEPSEVEPRSKPLTVADRIEALEGMQSLRQRVEVLESDAANNQNPVARLLALERAVTLTTRLDQIEQQVGHPASVAFYEEAWFVSLLTVVLAAVAPITTAVFGHYKQRLEAAKQAHDIVLAATQQKFTISTGYIDRATDPKVPRETRVQLFRYLSVQTDHPSLKSWADLELQELIKEITEIQTLKEQGIVQKQKLESVESQLAAIQTSDRERAEDLRKQKEAIEKERAAILRHLRRYDPLPTSTGRTAWSHLRPSLVKRFLLERDGRCVRCGESNPDVLEVDRVIPRSAGGTDELSNLQILCQNCNARKGGKIP